MKRPELRISQTNLVKIVRWNIKNFEVNPMYFRKEKVSLERVERGIKEY